MRARGNGERCIHVSSACGVVVDQFAVNVYLHGRYLRSGRGIGEHVQRSAGDLVLRWQADIDRVL